MLSPNYKPKEQHYSSCTENEETQQQQQQYSYFSGNNIMTTVFTQDFESLKPVLEQFLLKQEKQWINRYCKKRRRGTSNDQNNELDFQVERIKRTVDNTYETTLVMRCKDDERLRSTRRHLMRELKRRYPKLEVSDGLGRLLRGRTKKRKNAAVFRLLYISITYLFL